MDLPIYKKQKSNREGWLRIRTSLESLHMLKEIQKLIHGVL